MRIRLALLSLFFTASLSYSADTMPLLCDTNAVLVTPAVSSPAFAPAAPADCPAPAEEVCLSPADNVLRIDATGTKASTSRSATSVNVPVTTVVNETRTVPVKRKIYVDETYVVDEKTTITLNEMQTRKAYRTEKHVEAREVKDAYIRPISVIEGKAPRLTRRVTKRMETYEAKTKVPYDETVVVPVKRTLVIPVVKTRRVAREVEEYKTVTVPVKTTTYQSRIIRGTK